LHRDTDKGGIEVECGLNKGVMWVNMGGIRVDIGGY
jgi:hypothetical protein